MSAIANLSTVILDCADPARLAEFYTAVTGWDRTYADDDFVFIGHPGRQERLVGNAFPPLWAESIASHIATELHDVLSG